MPKKFDFISPGVQLNEIDESVLPAATTDAGPCLIGRALSGPAMQPVRVSNYADFKAIFGAPVSGEGASKADVWRDGNVVGPTYASYAAQAHLASNTTPVTFVRLLGEKSDQASTNAASAGWWLGSAGQTTTTLSTNVTAYGLFIFPSASLESTGTLGAIIYSKNSAVTLSGTVASHGGTATTSSAGVFVHSAGSVASQFTIEIWDSVHDGTTTGSPTVSKVCNFTNGAVGFIRDQLNTNPQKIQGSKNFGVADLKYFLGETYEQAIADQTSGSSAAKQYGIVLPLQKGSFNYADHKIDMQTAKTGWFINRKPGEEELFRLTSLHSGEWFQNNYVLFVEDLKVGDRLKPSSFSLTLKNLGGSTVEKYSGLNLDPGSDNYIAKRIGNQTFSWNASELKYDVRGLYVNKSDYFYVEVSDAVANKTMDDTLALPMGFKGPLRPKKFQLVYGSSGPNAWGDTDNSGVVATGAAVFGNVLDEDASITFNHPDGITYIITTTTGGGTDSAWTSSGANYTADVDRTIGGTVTFATAVAVLMAKISGYTASNGGTGTVTVAALYKGSHWTWTWSEADDDGNDLALGNVTAGTDTDDVSYVAVKGNDDVALRYAGLDDQLFCNLPIEYSASVQFPALRLTTELSNGGGNYKKKEYFGIRHHLGESTDRNASYGDLVRALPGNIDNGSHHHQSTVPSTHELSFIFHMEDIKVSSTDTTQFFLASGSYAAGTSVSYTGGGAGHLTATKGLKQYRAAFWGGFDGLDVQEVEPFSNTNLDGAAATTNAMYNSFAKALDMVRDPEVVEMDMISMPGATLSTLTDKILKLATERGDSLAIIDLPDGYKPKWENAGSVSYGVIATTLASLETRQLNNSYGCCYYPWIVLRDSNADVVAVPPSVAAIGALAKSNADSEVWFAPAGFNRGGIKNLGSATSGLVVTHTIEHLTKDNRDDLYALSVNPIARFPATNQIVIFGQKTLQQTPSALDRINVRRLLLFLKRRIGKIANTILFEPNVQTTWNNFKRQADAVLSDVKSKLGVTEYKLVLDESTTTADLIDRNVMYAKIFIKPARAIEYIVVDFIVTRSGVDF